MGGSLKMRLILAVVGLLAIAIIFGGFAVIRAYASGDFGIVDALWNGTTSMFNFSWIAGLIFLLFLGLIFYGIYSGLRSDK